MKTDFRKKVAAGAAKRKARDEERRRAKTADAIKQGIKNKVVRAR